MAILIIDDNQTNLLLLSSLAESVAGVRPMSFERPRGRALLVRKKRARAGAGRLSHAESVRQRLHSLVPTNRRFAGYSHRHGDD